MWWGTIAPLYWSKWSKFYAGIAFKNSVEPGFPHSGGGAEGVVAHPPIFFETPRPLWKPMTPHGALPHLKNKLSPLLKREPPFHEIFPWKSTINNNVKSCRNPWKICVKKLIFSKFAGLQAYSRQLYYQMNSLTSIFWQHFKRPDTPLMYWLKPPPSPCCQ